MLESESGVCSQSCLKCSVLFSWENAKKDFGKSGLVIAEE